MRALRILYITSELAPLTGDGDFAKEVHFLSRAIADLGMDVMVAVPGYRVPNPTSFGIARRLKPLAVHHASDPFDCTVHEGNLAGGRVKVLVLEVPESDPGSAVTRFGQAALALAAQDGGQTEMLCVGPGTESILAMARGSGPGEGPVTVLALRDWSDHGALRDALPHADRIVVSSPGLATELRQRPDDDPLGALLAPVRQAIRGITGGVDSVLWSPHHDRVITSDIAASKAEHKRQLKRRLGLRGGAHAALFALVGPFDSNVLSEEAVAELVQRDAVFVVLADANRDHEACQWFESQLRQGRLVLQATQDQSEFRDFEHDLLGAADMALYLRDYAHTGPCNLYSMHYGVVPIVPNTPGYGDLLVDFDIRTATGSGFLYDPARPGHLVTAVDRALRAYHQPGPFAQLVQRVSHFDLSWRTTARRYIDLAGEILREREAAQNQTPT